LSSKEHDLFSAVDAAGAVASGDSPEASEVAHLEALLYEAGKALRAAEIEGARRERLVRDMAEQIRAMGAHPAVPSALPGTKASDLHEAPVLAALRGEVMGLRHRVRDREASVAAFRVSAADLAQALARAASLEETVTALRRRTNELNVRCVEAEERAGRETAKAASFSASARAHDAIVDRLRKSLHDNEARILELTQEMARLRDERERLRGVASAASDQGAEFEALQLRLGQMDAKVRAASERASVALRQRDSAVRAMDETKAILEGLRAQLGPAPGAGNHERSATVLANAEAETDDGK
jgi:DNA repair exonuclease SbcCD ATPase subunit